MDFETESLAEARRLGRRERRYAPLPVEYGEVRDREVRAYADHVAPGVYELRTLARVRALGSFAHAPAGIEAMYAPELNGSSGSPPFVTAR